MKVRGLCLLGLGLASLALACSGGIAGESKPGADVGGGVADGGGGGGHVTPPKITHPDGGDHSDAGGLAGRGEACGDGANQRKCGPGLVCAVGLGNGVGERGAGTCAEPLGPPGGCLNDPPAGTVPESLCPARGSACFDPIFCDQYAKGLRPGVIEAATTCMAHADGNCSTRSECVAEAAQHACPLPNAHDACQKVADDHVRCAPPPATDGGPTIEEVDPKCESFVSALTPAGLELFQDCLQKMCTLDYASCLP
jgi:hypothetical protein